MLIMSEIIYIYIYGPKLVNVTYNCSVKFRLTPCILFYFIETPRVLICLL